MKAVIVPIRRPDEPVQPPQSFGDALRTRRIELGYTQEQLAGILDVSQATITRWENGGAFPRSHQLKPLATTLQMPLEALVSILEQFPFEPPASMQEKLDQLKEQVSTMQGEIHQILDYLKRSRGQG